MIVGASYDIQGSSRAQLHLHQILDASGVNAVVMPGSEFLLGRSNMPLMKMATSKTKEPLIS